MRRILFILAGLVGLYFAWRWWTARNRTAAEVLSTRQVAADQFGQRAENAGLANRPRLASDEAIGRLWGILTNPSPQTASAATPATVPRDPFVFGFN
jgi:hypothetical protein